MELKKSGTHRNHRKEGNHSLGLHTLVIIQFSFWHCSTTIKIHLQLCCYGNTFLSIRLYVLQNIHYTYMYNHIAYRPAALRLSDYQPDIALVGVVAYIIHICIITSPTDLRPSGSVIINLI